MGRAVRFASSTMLLLAAIDGIGDEESSIRLPLTEVMDGITDITVDGTEAVAFASSVLGTDVRFMTVLVPVGCIKVEDGVAVTLLKLDTTVGSTTEEGVGVGTAVALT